MLKRRLLSRRLRRSFSPSFAAGHYFGSFIFTLVSISALVVSLFSPGALSEIRSDVTDMITPAVTYVSAPMQQASLFVRDISGLAQLQSQNADLKKENQMLRQWHQKAMTLDNENKSLKELLNIRVGPEYSFVSARIISDPNSNFVKSMLVNVGTNNDVEVGSAVVSAHGLIGRIIEVGENSARVLLITDLNSKVPVIIDDQGLHGILSGTNEENPVLQYTLHNEIVTKGSRIVTSGHGGLFPKGIPIGVVSKGGQKNPEISLYADTNYLLYVKIIKQKKLTLAQ